jgi:type VI secretion system protein VasD
MIRSPLALVPFLAMALLSACASLPAVVHVNVTAAQNLNPGPGVEANPAQVRVYLLKEASRFSNADYFQLADKEQTVLGDDLLTRNEVIIHPGETKQIDLRTKPGARFVGAAVAYRNIDQATWRAVAPARGEVALTLGPDSAQLSQPK